MSGRLQCRLATEQGLRRWARCAAACRACRPYAAAAAQRIENSTAVFAALDKVTAAVKQIGSSSTRPSQFGALKVTPRACYTRAPTEPPRTTTFVEVDEILLDGKEKRIFTGWMFAESPGLNPLVHPVFDVWLTGCSQPQRAPAPAAEGPAGTRRRRRAAATPPRASRGASAPPCRGDRSRFKRARASDSEDASPRGSRPSAGPGNRPRASAPSPAACETRRARSPRVPNCFRCSVTNCVSSSAKPPWTRRAHR